jgi:DNA-binding CsgD family transcriptional regulator
MALWLAMKGRRIQWRFGWPMLGWGLALAAGAILLAWADYQRLARTHAGDIALLLVAGLFLGLGLWLGLSFRHVPAAPPGNPAAVASLGLTPREVEVLQLLAAGQANKEIARAMGVSPNTVKTHLAHLFEKLGASSRTAAIARSRELGLIG